MSGVSMPFCTSLTGFTQNSNVVQFVAALKKDDPSRQMVYYQPGIGTSTNSGPGLRAFSKAMDLMLAWSLGKHVRGEVEKCFFGVIVLNSALTDGYEFLMQNCRSNDEELIAYAQVIFQILKAIRLRYSDSVEVVGLPSLFQSYDISLLPNLAYTALGLAGMLQKVCWV
jgi:hypothetical protein